MPAHRLTPEPDLLQATIEVLEAGQDVVVNRIELLRAELRDDVEDILLGSALVIAGVGIFALGYLSLLASAVWALAVLWSPVGALALAGLLHALVGAFIGRWAIQRIRDQKLFAKES